MANYILGAPQDYIPQIQGFKPDYNFLANVLQTRQSRYDSNYAQLSGVYSSLFNSPMMRDSDIKRKDDFFKNIDQNIKKISGMDLSLQQNADIANKVFQPFYDDKNLVNDMVTTKKYLSGVDKHNALKGCVDPSKCGGEAWEPGLAELNYKADEYKKTTDSEALDFQMPSYTPYYNWKKEALKSAKDQGFDVTQEYTNGQYIVTDKNGTLVKGGLYGLYKQVYGNDARVSDNYKTQAYVKRKQTVEATIGQYGSEEGAERAYSNSIINGSSQRLAKMQNEFNGISAEVSEAVNAKEEKKKGQGLTPDENTLDALLATKNNIDNTVKSLEVTHNGIHNNAESTDLRMLRNRADNAAIYELEQADMMDWATTMSLKGKSHEIKVDSYGLASHTSALSQRNAKEMALFNHEIYKNKVSIDLMAKMTFEDHKQAKDSGAVDENAVVMDNLPWLTKKGGVDENKELGQDHNAKIYQQGLRETKGSAADFLLNTLTTAKAAMGNKNYTVAATNYLKNTFGNDWAKIENTEQLTEAIEKSGRPMASVFEAAILSLNKSKNPSTSLDWASTMMDKNGAQIQDIKENNIVNNLRTDHIRNANKDIVKSIKGQMGGDNPEYRDADLLLTPVGFYTNEDDFTAKYKARYGNTGNAKKAFEKLNDKFNDTYDKTPGIGFDQGANIGGVQGFGTTGGHALAYQGLSPLKPQSPGRKELINHLTDLTSPTNSGAVTVITGLPTEENISSENIPEVAAFMNTFLNDYKKWNGPKDKAPVTNVIFSNMAGGNTDLSAVSVTVNEKYLNQYLGTIKNPTALAAFKDEILTNGISMVYPSTIQTPTVTSMRADNIEEMVKLTGVSIEESTFPKGGSVTIVKDGNTGNAIITKIPKVYDTQTHNLVNGPPNITTVPIAGIRKVYESQIKILETEQAGNISAEPWIAQWHKENP